MSTRRTATAESTPAGHAQVVEVVGVDLAAVPDRPERATSVLGGWVEDLRRPSSLVAVVVRLSRALSQDEARALPAAWQQTPVVELFAGDPTGLTRALTRGPVRCDPARRDHVVVWVPTTLPARALEAVEQVHRRTLDVALREP
ncbi:hypothetical protein AB2L28_00905 [Kineococcus sp. TBRC 1896]|uniref:Uncharacterized protein n=1 Tax=Kineococcus mangrovi TaxID=1660183 RepID=A0ABV4HYC6_9ACTN